LNIYKHYTIQDLSSLYIDGLPNIDLDFSYKFSQAIAQQHYENFPVGSILVPKSLRKYFFSIYAFSRLADDIADENYIENNVDKLKALQSLKSSLVDLNTTDIINNPILLSLKDTINKFNIPITPFLKLTSAFSQDINFIQPNNWEDVRNYCDNSANPVGEIVLRLFDEYNEHNKYMSDQICTGLQLINFWQDFSRDFENGRCYIPKDILSRNDIIFTENKLIGNLENLEKVFFEIYSQTTKIYNSGKALPDAVNNKRLQLELRSIIEGGEKVFSKIIKLENKILIIRPKVTKFEFLIILFKILF